MWARYWFGTAVHIVRQVWDEAERTLHDLLDHGMPLPTWEMWMRSWIHNRLGVVALARKQQDAAWSHFGKESGARVCPRTSAGDASRQLIGNAIDRNEKPSDGAE